MASGVYYTFGRLVLLGYIAHSLLLLALLRINRVPTHGFVVWAQVSDIAWPALLCLFTDAPNSIFFIFFLFAMLAAAFRWGFVETLTTAMIGAGLLLFQAASVKYGPPPLQHYSCLNGASLDVYDNVNGKPVAEAVTPTDCIAQDFQLPS